MPAIAAQPHTLPDGLFSLISDGDLSGNWWVIHTRPRSEKSLARHISSHGGAYFLPMGTIKRRVQRRWVETQLPLFPGYLFLYGNEQSYLNALGSNKIVNHLEVRDEPQLHQDLLGLHRLIESNHSLSLEPKLNVGSQVEITDGALAGLRGRVTRCDTETRIIIEVKMLNQQVSAQIDSCLLRKI